jgi:phosphatidylserine/phosphatidylglycerophosphate/cardiolipin synthase-like enzyme
MDKRIDNRSKEENGEQNLFTDDEVMYAPREVVHEFNKIFNKMIETQKEFRKLKITN